MLDADWQTLSIGLALVLVTCFIYSRILKPYQQYSFYKKILSANYKAYCYPFSVFLSDSLIVLQKDKKKYGDCLYSTKTLIRDYDVTLSMFQGVPFVMLVDSALIKEFLQHAAEGYYLKATKSLLVQPLKILFGNGTLMAQGDQWKLKRKIMSKVFNFQFIKSKIYLISDIVKQNLNKIESDFDKKGSQQIRMNVGETLRQIFGNVVTKSFFGDIKLSEINGQQIFIFLNKLQAKNTERMLSAYGMALGPKVLSLKLRKIDRQVYQMADDINTYAKNIINQQIQSEKQNLKTKNLQNQATRGIIQLLIKDNKLKNDASDSLSEGKKDYYTTTDLVDQFKTFFFAGTVTTVSMTDSLLFQLAINKQLREKVIKQIDSVFGDNYQEMSYEKLKSLKYLEKCQKEILRMYCPIPRTAIVQATKDHFIGNIPIKAGVLISVDIIACHFQTKFYNQPQVFNPDRWDEIDLSNPSSSYLYIPFSAGSRSCIGQQLAMLQSRVALVYFLKRYKSIIPERLDIQYMLRPIYAAQSMFTTFIK